MPEDTKLNQATDPLAVFDEWLALAKTTELNDPNAMSLATATLDGVPSVRMVLMKGRDNRGFTFFTNGESRKGGELRANPNAALCFHWKSLQRQVRVTGTIAELDGAEVDAYFHRRHRMSQIGAWASQQSRPLATREDLIAATHEMEAKFPDEVPRPPYWTGFVLRPTSIELWQERDFRLHDRIVFTAEADGGMVSAEALSMNELSPPPFSPRDLADLRRAIANLEGSSLAMNIAAKVGMPVEALIRFLPERAQESIGTAVDNALRQCLRVALALGKGGSGSALTRRSHTLATAITGAAGGFFGLPGLVVELPVTTTVMLHSIAGIAAAQGEDLTNPESAIACLQVLALGPDGMPGQTQESAYYATRAALAQVTRDAAAYVAQKGMAKEGAPVLLSFLSKIAARFGLEVSEKAAAQLIPVAGAAGGLALNVLFITHFQRLADGHFTIRRLERRYGSDRVRQEYAQIQRTGPTQR